MSLMKDERIDSAERTGSVYRVVVLTSDEEVAAEVAEDHVGASYAWLDDKGDGSIEVVFEMGDLL